MLVVRPKISDLSFRVFGRSVHPELFNIFASRAIVRERYQLKVDITSSGHVLTWQGNGQLVSEVVTASHQPLPEFGRLFSEPASVPGKQEMQIQEILDYGFQFQMDPADPLTFATIQRELMKSVPCEGLVFQFQASGRMSIGAVSYVNVQSRQNEVHIRAFHTFPDALSVLKTESFFNLK